MAHALSSLDALARLARDYPGGVAALAQRLGKHPGTLRSELRPPAGSTAKLGWEDALELMELAQQVGLPGALLPLDVAEQGFGRLFVATLPNAENAGSDHALMASVARCAKEFGEVMAEVARDAADGRISDNELKRAQTQAGELIAELGGLLALLQRMNAASKPAHLHAVGAC